MRLYIPDILERQQRAFGFVAQNIAPRLAQSGWTKSNFLMANIPLYTDNSASFADIELKNVNEGFVLQFGQLPSQAAHPALPFQKTDESVVSSIYAAPPVVKFSRSKRINITAIDKSDIEVVENFGIKPWEIQLMGILVDMDEHWYPQELVQKLRQLFEINDTFEVKSDLFLDLGITELYLTDIDDLGFVEGYNDTIKYSLKARASKPAIFQTA